MKLNIAAQAIRIISWQPPAYETDHSATELQNAISDLEVLRVVWLTPRQVTIGSSRSAAGTVMALPTGNQRPCRADEPPADYAPMRTALHNRESRLEEILSSQFWAELKQSIVQITGGPLSPEARRRLTRTMGAPSTTDDRAAAAGFFRAWG
jgi:hypothetical protein